jgi:CYTH domain-containing protein
MIQPAPPRLQFTSVRTRVVDGQVLVGLKHTAKDASDERVVLPWIEMPVEDAQALMKTLQDVLGEQAKA